MGSSSSQKNALKLQAQTAQESLDLQKLALSQPKITQADNFAAQKLKSLNSLRLGLASTISSPMVNAAKTKLGS